MKLSSIFCASLLRGSSSAVPTGDHGLETRSKSSGPGVGKHGDTRDFKHKCPFTVKPIPVHRKHVHHDIPWSQGCRDDGQFINWRTYKANGANLGGWLAKERTHDPIWWASLGSTAAATPDEWNLCQALGKSCGYILEERYRSFLNTSTIDTLASIGINTLRITTTYAAWVDVPGSAFYHGNHQAHLRKITNYAIKKYKMHIIIGLHSLPGGINNLDIGEALFHDARFYNTTNLDYSLKAVDKVLKFIENSGHMNAFTIAPINEASDNLAAFGSADGLSEKAAAWIMKYMDGVLTRVVAVDKRIPVMLQDSFKGASYWSPLFDANTNLVIDSHVYFFAAAGTYSQYVSPAICGQASYLGEETKFPVFIGEWSLQTMYNNTLDVTKRKSIFDTQRYAWQKHVSGGAFWTAVSHSNTDVGGEGVQRDFWSLVDLIKAGVATKATSYSYC